jgi:anti-anti-sigma factor
MKTQPPDRGGHHVAAFRPHHAPRARRFVVTALEVPRLETSATRIGGANAIAVTGELDMETAPQLSEEVEIAVWSTVGAFVLDLTGVTFLDSSGLHSLLRARAYLAREDRLLVLVCPPGPARRVLDLASVLDTFVVYASAEAAADALVPIDE